jgi:hypothetical protein
MLAIQYIKLAVPLIMLAVQYIKLAVLLIMLAVQYIKLAVQFIKLSVQYIKLAVQYIKLAVIKSTNQPKRISTSLCLFRHSYVKRIAVLRNRQLKL